MDHRKLVFCQYRKWLDCVVQSIDDNMFNYCGNQSTKNQYTRAGSSQRVNPKKNCKNVKPLNNPQFFASRKWRNSLMFFTTADSFGSIVQANMDGSNQTTIVSYKVFYPTSLKLDLANQQIYWLDKYMDYIERVDYNGSNRWSLKADIGSFMRPMFSIALFESNIYITKRSIFRFEMWRINRRNTNSVEKMFSTKEQPFEMRIFHAQSQPAATNPCSNNVTHPLMNCAHLCVLTHGRNENLQAQCVCKAGYHLKNEHECILVKQNSFLFFAKQSPTMIRGISIANATETEDAQECMVPILNVKGPLYLDYNMKDQLIYFGQNDMYVFFFRCMEISM